MFIDELNNYFLNVSCRLLQKFNSLNYKTSFISTQQNMFDYYENLNEFAMPFTFLNFIC